MSALEVLYKDGLITVEKLREDKRFIIKLERENKYVPNVKIVLRGIVVYRVWIKDCYFDIKDSICDSYFISNAEKFEDVYEKLIFEFNDFKREIESKILNMINVIKRIIEVLKNNNEFFEIECVDRSLEKLKTDLDP